MHNGAAAKAAIEDAAHDESMRRVAAFNEDGSDGFLDEWMDDTLHNASVEAAAAPVADDHDEMLGELLGDEILF